MTETLRLSADRESAAADSRSRGSLKRPLRGRRFGMTETLLSSQAREDVIGFGRPLIVIDGSA